MKDTDLKHLTPKTAFLLALASGKRRSEIHAWVANKISNLGQWEKVALFPSDFIAKNQLAREGSQSVSPVTIPALTTIVDRQFKEDRTLYQAALNVLEICGNISGLRVNTEKTQIVWFGKKKGDKDKLKANKELHWGSECFSLLGINLSVNLQQIPSHLPNGNGIRCPP